MDAAYTFVSKLALPVIYPFLPSSRIFWLYLAGAALLAFFAWRLLRAEGAPTDAGGGNARFIRYCFPRKVYAHPSAVVDYKYYVASRLFHAFGLMPLLLAVPAVAGATADGLERLLGPVSGTYRSPGLAVQALYTLAVMVAFDLGVFVAHYLQHRVPVLWEFHKVHHSARVLTPITVYRMHPVDDLFSGFCVALTVGAVVGAFSWALGGPVGELLVLGVNLGLFLFYIVGYNLRHSHVWLSYPRWLSWLLVSPAQHQIHHSRAPVHFDKNLGFVFSIWDRMAKTLYVPAEREVLEFGLGSGEDEDYGSVTALYLLPFRKAAGLFRVPGRER